VRGELVRYGRLLYERGYVVAADGNLSVREGDRVLITPSQLAYDAVREEDVAELALEGEVLSGRPSSERAVHLAVYRARPEVRAVVHAHPVHACALAVLGRPLPALLDEVGPVLGGEVRVSEHAASGSPELGAVAVSALEGRNAVILARHGTVTVGASLEEAFWRLEVLERAAHVHLLTLRV
jgi:L-ribulose-5-phosphate 4-epimerase